MNINFRSISDCTENELLKHAKGLANITNIYITSGFIDNSRPRPLGFETYTCVDVFGEEFIWLNQSFPKEKYTWYIWFESIFLVTPEMVSF